MKTLLLTLLITAAAVAPLYIHARRERADESRRLDQMEKDLAQAQQDIGEMKQLIQMLLRRGEAAD